MLNRVAKLDEKTESEIEKLMQDLREKCSLELIALLRSFIKGWKA